MNEMAKARMLLLKWLWKPIVYLRIRGTANTLGRLEIKSCWDLEEIQAGDVCSYSFPLAQGE